ncbi:hypothetical protein E2C01_077001 [Portunus trituberculatus]|uniref:Uncharacterized protein n=1 Tax=Portunus trituberculatus TaxID=210409 RepID=A0A5B7IEN8_PORTR|nr:hypothetical protein [Portunus trituberculatus]
MPFLPPYITTLHVFPLFTATQCLLVHHSTLPYTTVPRHPSPPAARPEKPSSPRRDTPNFRRRQLPRPIRLQAAGVPRIPGRPAATLRATAPRPLLG